MTLIRTPKGLLLTAIAAAAAALALVAAGGGFGAEPADAQVHTQSTTAGYIKFDGLDGEARDDGHKGWSDLHSFSQAIRAGGGEGGGSISVTKPIDKATPLLARAAATGHVFATATIELTRSSGDGKQQAYLRYELKRVLVSSYQTGGSSDRPLSTAISLNFEEIKVTYIPFDPDGSQGTPVTSEWNARKGR